MSRKHAPHNHSTLAGFSVGRTAGGMIMAMIPLPVPLPPPSAAPGLIGPRGGDHGEGTPNRLRRGSEVRDRGAALRTRMPRFYRIRVVPQP